MAYPLVKKFSQNDWRWRRTKLGNSWLTIGSHGCLITCLAMIAMKSPPEVNKILVQNNCFNQAGELYIPQACRALGLSYGGKTNNKQFWLAVAETNYYRGYGYPQHFFIWFGDGMIIDTIDGKYRKINDPKYPKYPIIQYILIDNGRKI